MKEVVPKSFAFLSYCSSFLIVYKFNFLYEKKKCEGLLDGARDGNKWDVSHF